MWKIRELSDKMTNVVMNYSEVESKVREATNDDTWGPHGSLMQEIARYTFTYEHFPEVMSMLWRRMLQEHKKNWRRSYKGLLLLGYLLRNGSERVVTSARDHIYDMRQLENFHFTDENGKDQGINVRHKVKELLELVQDDERMRSERKKAKKTRDKYTGMSSDKYRESHYTDRYDPEARQQDSFDEFNSKTTKKSKYREWRERAGSFGQEFKDSEDEEGEEASEEKGKDEPNGDAFNTQKSIFKSAPSRKLDLGAAAHYTGIATESSTIPENPSVSNTTSTMSNDQSSTSKEFFEFFAESPPKSTQSVSPIRSNAVTESAADPFGGFQSTAATGANDSGFADFSNVSTSPGFGDFASFQPTTAPQVENRVSDDDFFSDFHTSDAAQPQSITSPPSNTFSTQPVPSVSAQSDELMGLSLNPSMSTTSSMPYQMPMGAQSSMGMPSTMPMGMPPNQLGMPMMPPMTMQSNSSMMQPQMNAPMMQQGMPQQAFSGYNAGPTMMTNAAAFNKPFGEKQGSTSDKSTMWSNSRVDISLDSLIPTLNRDKPQQPSMNQLLMSQPKPSQTPYNSPQQGAYSLGTMQMSNTGQTNYMNQQPSNIGMMSNQGSMSPRMMPSSIRTPPMGGGSTGVFGAQPMGMVGSRPMSSPQGFNSNSFTTYKGIS
ncbi:hypothetical protein QZH41_014220 [Actinostola sp. cb2023]|nr:hypothetical protein QZH41_014220 [Actinostola sp. cb2023]